jgi:hypothetical protein
VPAVTCYYLLSLPLAVGAIFLGRVVNQGMQGRRFIVYFYIGLIVIGATLLIESNPFLLGRKCSPSRLDHRKRA